MTTIYTDNALRKMFEVLRRNGIIAILIDQTARRWGANVPFLGKESYTVRTVAGMVLKTGCAVVPTYAIMREDGSYEIRLHEAPLPDFTNLSDEERNYAVLKQHNDIISGWIEAHPEHWFGWFHRRFWGFVKYAK